MRALVCALLAMALCLCATTIWAELVYPRPTSSPGLPVYLQRELLVFGAIVWPAVKVGPSSLNGAYAMAVNVESSASIGCLMYSPTPSWAAFEFLRVGIPFWFLVLYISSGLARTVLIWRRAVREH